MIGRLLAAVPVLILGAGQAITACILVFLPHVTHEQTAAVLGVEAALATLFVHRRVTPVAPADRGF